MASTIKQRLRRFNGTDYDTIHLESSADAIIKGSSDVGSLIDTLNSEKVTTGLYDTYAGSVLYRAASRYGRLAGDCPNLYLVLAYETIAPSDMSNYNLSVNKYILFTCVYQHGQSSPMVAAGGVKILARSSDDVKVVSGNNVGTIAWKV